MANYSHFLGIDISKNTLDFALLDDQMDLLTQGQLSNSPTAIGRLISRLKREFSVEWSTTLICCEHTGVYALPLQKMVKKKGLFLWMENPLQVKRSQGMTRGKSDSLDAFRLAEYSFRFQDKAVSNSDKAYELQALKNLLTTRKQLKKALQSLSAHGKELQKMDPEAAKRVAKHTKASRHALEQEIALIEKEIVSELKNRKEFSTNFQLLNSIPGIGPVTAAYLILVTWNFERLLDHKRLASFGGMAPFSYSSGTSIRTSPRVSHMADKTLKTLFQLAAFNAIRSDSGLRQYYQRKIAEGKPVLLVANNLRNKLLQRVVAVIKRQQPYRKDPIDHL